MKPSIPLSSSNKLVPKELVLPVSTLTTSNLGHVSAPSGVVSSIPVRESTENNSVSHVVSGVNNSTPVTVFLGTISYEHISDEDSDRVMSKVLAISNLDSYTYEELLQLRKIITTHQQNGNNYMAIANKWDETSKWMTKLENKARKRS